MSTNNSIRRAVRCALHERGRCGSPARCPAHSQADQTIQEVVVTGSRIAQPNLDDRQPGDGQSRLR